MRFVLILVLGHFQGLTIAIVALIEDHLVTAALRLEHGLSRAEFLETILGSHHARQF